MACFLDAGSRLSHELLAAGEQRDGSRVVLGQVKGGGDALGTDHTLVASTNLKHTANAQERTVLGLLLMSGVQEKGLVILSRGVDVRLCAINGLPYRC